MTQDWKKNSFRSFGSTQSQILAATSNFHKDSDKNITLTQADQIPHDGVDSNNKDQWILEVDLQIKGSYLEDKFTSLLTEIITQTCQDYLIELYFQSHINDTKSKSLFGIPETNEIKPDDKQSNNETLLNLVRKVNSVVDSMKYESSNIHSIKIKSYIIFDQIFEYFTLFCQKFDKEIKSRVSSDKDQNSLPLFFILKKLSKNDQITTLITTKNFVQLEHEYKENFKYPNSFLRKENPKIIAIFCGNKINEFLKSTNKLGNELQWLEKLKVFEPLNRGGDDAESKIPRNIYIEFCITKDIIQLTSYNLLEEIFLNLEKVFIDIATWTSKRYITT